MRKPFHPALQLAFDQALRYLERVEDLPIAATASAEQLRSRLHRPWNAAGEDPQTVLAELARGVEGGLNNSVNARFYGWVIGGSLPAALAADWLTSAWDQNAGLFATSPAAAVVEEVVGEWLKNLFGLPKHASFALVTGCQVANTTCLAGARSALLGRRGWDVERRGLGGAPALRAFCGRRHSTIDRSLRLLGLGDEALVPLEITTDGTLDPRALQGALREFQGPAIVLLQAGDVNTGAFDDFSSLIPVAHEHGAWVHVDGAFGLWAAASPRFAHLVRGVGEADSWAVDGHKWLNVPYDCGYAFVADRAAHRAAMSYPASYLTQSSGVRDENDWTPELSRRARGFASYAALRELGRDGVREVVERGCECAAQLVSGLGRLEGVDVVSAARLNQGLVAFRDPAGKISDSWNDAVISAIAAEGTAFFSGTTWEGRRAMRVSVSNWQTAPGDVEKTIAAVARVLARMGAGRAAHI